MYKYEEQFRAENPQTIGEIDQQFDLSNYKDWLEKKLDAITPNRTSIYSMKLHEVIALTPTSIEGTAVSYFSIMRVPGGWIYQVWDDEKQDYIRETFVPFNKEGLCHFSG